MKPLKIKEVAEMFRVNPQLIYRMVRQKKIPFIKIGGSIRINEQVVKAILSGDSTKLRSEEKDLKNVYILLDANTDKVIRVCSRQDRASDYVQIYKKENKETYIKRFKVYKNIIK